MLVYEYGASLKIQGVSTTERMMRGGLGKSRYHAAKKYFANRQSAAAKGDKRWPQMHNDSSHVVEREKRGPHWVPLGGLIEGTVIMPYTDGEDWWETWSLMMVEHTFRKKGLERDANLMAMVDENGSGDLLTRAKSYTGRGNHSIWDLQAICLFQDDPEGDSELPLDGENDDEIDEANAKLSKLRVLYGKSAMVLLGKPGVVEKKLRTLLSGSWLQNKAWEISDFRSESLAILPQRSVRDKKQRDANCERKDYSPLPGWTAEVMQASKEMLDAQFRGTKYEGVITYADLSEKWKQEDLQKWDEQLTPDERSKLRLPQGGKLRKTTWKKRFWHGPKESRCTRSGSSPRTSGRCTGASTCGAYSRRMQTPERRGRQLCHASRRRWCRNCQIRREAKAPQRTTPSTRRAAATSSRGTTWPR